MTLTHSSISSSHPPPSIAIFAWSALHLTSLDQRPFHGLPLLPCVGFPFLAIIVCETEILQAMEGALQVFTYPAAGYRYFIQREKKIIYLISAKSISLEKKSQLYFLLEEWLHLPAKFHPPGFVLAWCGPNLKMVWEDSGLGSSTPTTLFTCRPGWQPQWFRWLQWVFWGALVSVRHQAALLSHGYHGQGCLTVAWPAGSPVELLQTKWACIADPCGSFQREGKKNSTKAT